MYYIRLCAIFFDIDCFLWYFLISYDIIFYCILVWYFILIYCSILLFFKKTLFHCIVWYYIILFHLRYIYIYVHIQYTCVYLYIYTYRYTYYAVLCSLGQVPWTVNHVHAARFTRGHVSYPVVDPCENDHEWRNRDKKRAAIPVGPH